MAYLTLSLKQAEYLTGIVQLLPVSLQKPVPLHLQWSCPWAKSHTDRHLQKNLQRGLILPNCHMFETMTKKEVY